MHSGHFCVFSSPHLPALISTPLPLKCMLWCLGALASLKLEGFGRWKHNILKKSVFLYCFLFPSFCDPERCTAPAIPSDLYFMISSIPGRVVFRRGHCLLKACPKFCSKRIGQNTSPPEIPSDSEPSIATLGKPEALQKFSLWWKQNKVKWIGYFTGDSAWAQGHCF